MTELERISCPNCGGNYNDYNPRAETMTCRNIGCGATFRILQAKAFAKVKIDHEVDIQSLRKLLDEAVMDEDPYLIERRAEDIRKLIPDDAFTAYCEALGQKRRGMFKAYANHLITAGTMTEWEADRILGIALMEQVFTVHDEGSLKAFIQAKYMPGQQAQREKLLMLAVNRLYVQQNRFANIPHDVFICHSSMDGIAQEVYDLLTDDGVSCWISERNMPPDTINYWEKIEQAIRRSRIILCITSKACMLSSDPVKEMELAEELGLERLELKIDDIEHTVFFRHFFNGIQWIKLGRNKQKTFQELKERIYHLLHGSDRVPEPPGLTFPISQPTTTSSNFRRLTWVLLGLFLTSAILLASAYFFIPKEASGILGWSINFSQSVVNDGLTLLGLKKTEPPRLIKFETPEDRVQLGMRVVFSFIASQTIEGVRIKDEVGTEITGVTEPADTPNNTTWTLTAILDRPMNSTLSAELLKNKTWYQTDKTVQLLVAEPTQVPTATVSVRYVDAATGLDVASSQQQAGLQPGQYIIPAVPADLQAYYVLSGSSEKSLTVYADGVPSPAEIVFHYNYIAPVTEASATSVSTAVPTKAPIDLWAEISKEKVNFRSKPDVTTVRTLVTQFNKGDKLWVKQQELVGSDLWYRVTYKGTDGYVLSEFAQLYSQEQSDAYQATLSTPVPEQTAFIPTEVPQPYQGYALTTTQVALRTGASARDETILATLPFNTLVYLWGQTYVEGVTWDHVDVLSSAQSGYIIDSALRRIDAVESEYHRSMLQPKVSPTPQITPTPQKVSGYAITLGDNVPMRSYFDTNAQITRVLPVNTIVAVVGQEYSADATWHVVQYAAQYGFIRADQLRMLSNQESAAYLESLRAPLVTPQATAAPLTQNTLSSYGYVNSGNVRLHRAPGVTSAEIKMMDKNAFALVLSSSQETDGTWYRINQGGMEGYVMGRYFTVLPFDQLTAYLQSPAYLSTNTLGTSTNALTSQNITAVEDYNSDVWQNPALAQTSYEPFLRLR